MTYLHPVFESIQSVQFKYLTAAEIRKASVVEITRPYTFDNLSCPVENGICDIRMGPLSLSDRCGTCHLPGNGCPGHLGRIELPVYVYNPAGFKQLLQILNICCPYCLKVRATRLSKKLLRAQTLLAGNNRLECALDLERRMNELLNSSTANLTAFENELDQIIESLIGRKRQPNDRNTYLYLVNLRKQFIRKSQSQTCPHCKACVVKFRSRTNAEVTAYPAKSGHNRLLNLVKTKFSDYEISRVSNKIGTQVSQSLDASFENTNYDGSATEAGISGAELSEQSGSDDSDASHADRNTEGLSGSKDPRHNESMALDKVSDRKLQLAKRSQILLGHHMVRAIVQLCCENDPAILSRLYGGAELNELLEFLFPQVLAVTPNRYRQTATSPTMTAFSSSRTYERILLSVEQIRAHQAGANGKLRNLWESLQANVNKLADNPLGAGSVATPPGLKQMLERKEGLFRMNMMGKRVNHAGRSVITPDPFIATDEIGVPPEFSTVLCIPEAVNDYNVERLRQAVINGPHLWPGANYVVRGNGAAIDLKKTDAAERGRLADSLSSEIVRPDAGHFDANLQVSSHPSNLQQRSKYATIAGGHTVMRHIRDGDNLIVNRQPTLSKVSLMSHRARILRGQRTIRMHYANCGSYNADFDGDEMNLHLPQSLEARSELGSLLSASRNYRDTANGSPLRGLIQDYVVSLAILTSRNTLITKEKYWQFLSFAMDEGRSQEFPHFVTVGPAIRKPVPMWTGMQLITTILRNVSCFASKMSHGETSPQLNLISPCKMGASIWRNPQHAPRDKRLAELEKKLSAWDVKVTIQDGEHLTGFMDKSQIGATRKGVLNSINELYGPEASDRFLTMVGRLLISFLQSHGFSCRLGDLLLTKKFEEFRSDTLGQSNDIGESTVDQFLNLFTDQDKKKRKERYEVTIRDTEQHRHLEAEMKGALNELTSKVVNACLPHGFQVPFPRNLMILMTASGAKGSQVNTSQISCLLGQQDLEGRRVPLMASGRSLPSFPPFDTSPRAGGYIEDCFIKGIGPQEYFFHCMAGREGLVDTAVKTANSGYLQRSIIKHTEGIHVAYDDTVRDHEGSVIQFRYGEDSLDVTKKGLLEDLQFSAQNYDALFQKYNFSKLSANENLECLEYQKKVQRDPGTYDPALLKYSPSRFIGCTGEHFDRRLQEFCSLHKKDFAELGFSARKFKALLRVCYMRSLVEPGDCVGVLAGTSIGHPSTQMTLNTFHLAGFGAANVTLGIPRLREILMTRGLAIKTPTMVFPFKSNISTDQMERFRRSLNRVTLASVTRSVRVAEEVSARSSVSFKIRIELFPCDHYESYYGVAFKHVDRKLRHDFLLALNERLKKDAKKKLSSKERDIEVLRTAGVVEGYMSENDDVPEEKVEETRDSEGVDEETSSGREEDKEGYDDEPEEAEEESDGGYESNPGSVGGPANVVDSAYEEIFPSTAEGKDTPADNDFARVSFCRRVAWANSQDVFEADFELNVSEVQPKYRGSAKNILLHQIEAVLKSVVLQQRLPGVRAVMGNIKNNAIAVSGWNFEQLSSISDVVDLNKITSNDISRVRQHYGIEAARMTIVNEIRAVFGAYSIDVDYRHLSLIADYMTHSGEILAMDRGAMAYNPSAITRMSFETSMSFLYGAAASQEIDHLTGPSSRLALGLPVHQGTGSFELMTMLQPALDFSEEYGGAARPG